MTTDTNGPAFPTSHSPDYQNEVVVGMTLRDYFAAKAMQALFSVCDVSRQGYDTELVRRAVQAYAMADAMLEARK